MVKGTSTQRTGPDAYLVPEVGISISNRLKECRIQVLIEYFPEDNGQHDRFYVRINCILSVLLQLVYYKAPSCGLNLVSFVAGTRCYTHDLRLNLAPGLCLI